MSKYFIWILLLTVINTILFFNKELGISVILFIIPLLSFIYYVLKNNRLIKNKYGLLFMIPIILLSLSYFIFNNDFFGYMNLLVIPLLFLIMYTLTINSSDKIISIIKCILELIIKPFIYITDFCNQLGDYLSSKIHISDNAKKIIKSFIIVLPILFVVLLLLTSADMVFDSLFSNLFLWMDNLVISLDLDNIIGRLSYMSFFFIYLSLVTMFLIKGFLKDKDTSINEKSFDSFTIKMLLLVLNIVYVIFDIIQIKSLIFHSLGEGFTYSEYARQGFFQLMFVSLINLIIILYSKKYKNEKSRYICIMSIVMVLLTFVIIISSFLRMNLYEQEYGYTVLRLLVYITLITEIILLIPTVKYIINSKTKILNYYIVIIVSIYSLINFINIDGVIAKRNITRYFNNAKLDLYYLENYSTDNVPDLILLYDKTLDEEMREELKSYLLELDVNINGFQEINISKMHAKKLIDDKFSS